MHGVPAADPPVTGPARPGRYDGGPITVQRIQAEINHYQFTHANEVELHTGLAEILEGKLGLGVRYEVTLPGVGRIDLATLLPRPGRQQQIMLGIEVKVDGAASDVRRQLRRYAGAAQLDALLLVTTQRRHLAEIMKFGREAEPGNDAGAKWLLDGMPFGVQLVNGGTR